MHIVQPVCVFAGVTLTSWGTSTAPSTAPRAATSTAVAPATTASAASTGGTDWTRTPAPTTSPRCGPTSRPPSPSPPTSLTRTLRPCSSRTAGQSPGRCTVEVNLTAKLFKYTKKNMCFLKTTTTARPTWSVVWSPSRWWWLWASGSPSARWHVDPATETSTCPGEQLSHDPQQSWSSAGEDTSQLWMDQYLIVLSSGLWWTSCATSRALCSRERGTTPRCWPPPPQTDAHPKTSTLPSCRAKTTAVSDEEKKKKNNQVNYTERRRRLHSQVKGLLFDSGGVDVSHWDTDGNCRSFYSDLSLSNTLHTHLLPDSVLFKDASEAGNLSGAFILKLSNTTSVNWSGILQKLTWDHLRIMNLNTYIYLYKDN